jgi:hypothetical protein
MNIRNLLIETIWSFSDIELQRFDKFLRSPYFKKEHFNNSKVYELFKILKSYFFRFPVDKRTAQHIPILNLEKVINKMFPSLTCPEDKQKRLGKVCSELISYILNFFAVENFQCCKVDFRISLSEEILKRNLSCLFEHNWKVKYFGGIYSEDEVTNVYHRYLLIRLANLHNEKCKVSRPDYELEIMLFKKYQKNIIFELRRRAKSNGYNLPEARLNKKTRRI